MPLIHPAPAGKIPILLYHDIESPDCPNEKLGAATRGTVVSAENFRAQVRFLHANGYRTLSLSEFEKFHRQQTPFPPESIIITFDDGHISNYEMAFPVLREYGYTACFFIVSERIGSPYHLSAEQIMEMSRAGMEFGSHGATHTYFPLLSSQKLKAELEASRLTLEKLIPGSIDFLAFPGGHYTKDALDAASAAGYKGACSCIQGFNSINTDMFRLRRIEIRGGFLAEDFQRLFKPFNLAMYQFIDTMKAGLRRFVGLRFYAEIRKKMYKFYLFKR